MMNGRYTDISVMAGEPGINAKVPARVLEGLDFKSYAIYGAVTMTSDEEGTLRIVGNDLTANTGSRSTAVRMPLPDMSARIEGSSCLVIDLGDECGWRAEFELQGLSEVFELTERVRECIRQKAA